MTSRHPASGTSLDTLCDALRHTVDQLRVEQPLLDESKLAGAVMSLQQSAVAFTESLPQARLAGKPDYLELRGPWLEAWGNSAAKMEAAARSALDGDISPSPADPKECAFWRLRLLAMMLARHGPARVRAMTNSINDEGMAYTELGMALAIDREAHEALREWGRLDFDALIRNWKQLKPELLKRAAAVVGIKAPKRWTRLRQEDFHRRARRFTRNTMV